MVSKKTSTKPQKSLKKSTPNKMKIGGMSFTHFSPAKELAENTELVREALISALMDGDKEAFQEILEGYLKAREISKTARKLKLSRTVIYEAIDKKKNPSLESLCKIMKAFKDVGPKPKKSEIRIAEIEKILKLAAENFNGDAKKAALWLRSKNPILGGISPREMIRLGRYQKLLQVIMNLKKGDAA